MAKVMLEAGWTPEFEIRELLALAQDADSPKLKLAAIKYLREIRDQALQNAGQLAQVSRTVLNPDGSVTRFSANVVANHLPNIPEHQSDNTQTLSTLNQETENVSIKESETTGEEFKQSIGSPLGDGPDTLPSSDRNGDVNLERTTPFRESDDTFKRGPAAAVIHRPTINFGHRNPVIISAGDAKPRN